MMTWDYRRIFAVVVIIVVLIFSTGAVISFFSLPGIEVVGTTTEARRAPEVVKEVTVALPIEHIQVYAPKLKAKVKLPTSVIADEKKHLVASSKISGDDRPRTISTVVDETTGQFVTYERIDPLPWIAVRTYTHIGAYYGLKNTEQVVRIQVQQELLQLKSLHVEMLGSVDIGANKTDTFIGIGGRFRF